MPPTASLLISERSGLLGLIEEQEARRGSNQSRYESADSGNQAVEFFHLETSFLTYLGNTFSLSSRMAPSGVSVKACQLMPSKRLMP